MLFKYSKHWRESFSILVDVLNGNLNIFFLNQATYINHSTKVEGIEEHSLQGKNDVVTIEWQEHSNKE